MNLTKKNKTIKLDYKISNKEIEFLDTMVYQDQQHKIPTVIFRKSTDQKHTYIHDLIIPNLLNTVFHTDKCYG